MKVHPAIRPLFVFAAAYDGILGAAFLIQPLALFKWFDVAPPNHVGYVQFPAMLLLVFAAMFVAIARQPIGNRNLIPYGIGLKLAYCIVVFGYWLTGNIPMMWKPFAVADAVFLLLFVWAYRSLAPGRNALADAKSSTE